MKTLLFAIIAIMLGFGATSCLNDDEETRPRYAEMGSTEMSAEDEPLVTTDSDLTLKLKSSPSDFEENQRVMITYSIDQEGGESDVYDYLVDVYSLQDVVTKEIMVLNEENRDTIGEDQIAINDIWIAGGYLNVEFFFHGTGQEVHYINVVKDPEEQGEDPTEIFLQVRHDARGEEMLERYRGIMSFHLESLQVEGEEMVTLIFENQNFYAPPYSTIEVEYEY